MTDLADSFRFDNRVVLVTGGSRGLGKAFSKLFARQGAIVVINSLGNTAEQTMSLSAAEQVKQEIEAEGGQAFLINRTVCDAESIIDFCLNQFGRLDVLVHNAGIVRDASLAKQDFNAWNDVYQVHLESAYKLSYCAWPVFKSQQYGRLLFISSAAGLYGNFGQANYSAAKLGMVGLSNTLAVEGARNNIHSNCVAPIAATQMNQKVLTAEQQRLFKVEDIAPIVGYLCHESCAENGSLFEAGGGWFSKVRWQRSKGTIIDKNALKIKEIAAQWDKICNFDDYEVPQDINESLKLIMNRFK